SLTDLIMKTAGVRISFTGNCRLPQTGKIRIVNVIVCCRDFSGLGREGAPDAHAPVTPINNCSRRCEGIWLEAGLHARPVFVWWAN
ncbi:MAG: hypothetical protein WCE69_05490, partial [Aestuariivirga sp.]